MAIGDRPGLWANRSSRPASGRAVQHTQPKSILTATDMQFQYVLVARRVDQPASSRCTASRNAKGYYLAKQSLVVTVFLETHRDGQQFSGPAVCSLQATVVVQASNVWHSTSNHRRPGRAPACRVSGGVCVLLEGKASSIPAFA